MNLLSLLLGLANGSADPALMQKQFGPSEAKPAVNPFTVYNNTHTPEFVANVRPDATQGTLQQVAGNGSLKTPAAAYSPNSYILDKTTGRRLAF
jgi:hypothetical protein